MTSRVRLLFRLALVCLVALASACTSPIVGSVCREGLTVCSGECVDLSTDRRHCGACDNACAADETCAAGMCMPSGRLDGGPDAGPRDGGPDAGRVDAGPFDAGTDSGPFDAGPPVDAGPFDAGVDGGPFDGGPFDGGPDAGPFDAGPPIDAGPFDAGPPIDAGAPPACGVGELLCDGVCVQPDRDPLHCGGCNRACGATQVCSDSMCEDTCSAPSMLCDGVCVDTRDDHRNCGDCSMVCPSGICANSMCQGAVAGHLVLIGHDFIETRPDMDRLAANSVFLGRGNPVRVLPYEGDAEAASIAGVDAAISAFAAVSGRTFVRQSPALASEVPLRLADADVLVVYAQTNASNSTLTMLGQDWAAALDGFLRMGGVVVVFDGLSANMGTHTILRIAGLLDANPGVDVTNQQLRVVDPGDAIALGVSLVYRARSSSVTFTVDAADAVVARVNEPVVVHRTVIP